MKAGWVVAALAAALSAGTADAQTVRTIDFTKSQAPLRLVEGDTQLTVRPRFVDRSNLRASVTVRAPGFVPVTVSEADPASIAFERVILAGKLQAGDPAPSVFIAGYSGGAHCCATLRVVTPFAGALRVLDFDAIDGEPSADFPQDLDGDGRADIVRQDDAFRYAFSSGAGSFSPPVILNIVDGQVRDVSAAPGFRPVWQAFAEETGTACFDAANSDRNGACIAYVAAGARLGDYPRTLARAAAAAAPGGQLGEGCRVAMTDGECPAGQEIRFPDFAAAAAWFLRAHGYID
jgi:hypothetical protein